MKLGVTVRDAQGVILYVNPADAGLHGYEQTDLVGKPASILGAPELRSVGYGAEADTRDHWERESLNVRSNGQTFPVLLRSDVIRRPDGEVLAVVTTCEDVTERKRDAERQGRDALKDALTGFANRTFFLELVARAVRATRREPDYRFAVLYLDLHRFRLVNETLGHDAGDQLLVQTAEILKSSIRPMDVAARIVGDEFAILLDAVGDRTGPVRVAERILERFGHPVGVGDEEVYLSPNIGIAVSEPDTVDPERYVKDAQLALMRAREGGEGYAFFDASVHRRATQRLHLETDLRRGIQQGELRAFYQPIVHLRTGDVVGFEALARWAHPVRGLTPPAEFIPAAEETGLVVPMGSWMLRAACAQLAEWRRRFPQRAELTVNVNLSARHLRQPNVVDEVTGLLAETGLAPEHLKLELTETMLMGNADHHVGVLRALHDVGVAVVIDDFGTGYSSLSYLQRFPVHALKIDRSFLANAREDGDWEIVRMIIALARDKGALVVAEGVETEPQALKLVAFGCDRAQGYLYSRPVEPEAAGQLLAV